MAIRTPNATLSRRGSARRSRATRMAPSLRSGRAAPVPTWGLDSSMARAVTRVIVGAARGVGSAIALEAGLSYLGLGVQRPTPSWGNMIKSGRDTLVSARWVATAPGIELVLVVVACTLLGDALRDVLDPRTRHL